MRTAWRIVKSRYAAAAFDGEGARAFGGRWNSAGTAVVYTAETQSLAVLELLVHIQQSAVLQSFSSIGVLFDDALVETVDAAALPGNWMEYPAPSALQQIGDQWAAGLRSAVLRVPSVVVPSESNFILNPRHPDFAKVEIKAPTAFRFDPRLVR